MIRPDMFSGAARPGTPRRRRGRALQTVAARAKVPHPRESTALRQLSDALELKALLGTLSERDQRIVAALMIAVLEVFQAQGEKAAQAALDQIDDILRGRKRRRGKAARPDVS